MAQSNVYSLNVVGYVNTKFVTGFNLVANPLSAPTNTLGNIMVGAHVPDNTQVLMWDTATQDFVADSPTYVAATGKWVPDATLAPGQACFVLAFTPFTNTFVGEVLQGSITNKIKPGFNTIASPVPIAGTTGVVLTNLPATDNDLAMKYDAVTQDFFADVPTYVQATGQWIPSTSWAVGEGMFYLSFQTEPSKDWVRTFTVQ
jgi:hypothetical protein